MNVLDLLAQKGIAARRVSTNKGGEWHSPCPDPGCGGDNRFHVWPEQNGGKGSYWCRQCGKKGDNIQFLRDFDGLSFQEACRRLDVEMSGKQQFRTPHVKLKNGGTAGGWQPTSSGEPKDLWQEKARKLVDWAHGKLLENKSQMRWLLERGILKKMVEQYQLGWIPEDMWRPRSAWGVMDEFKKNGKKLKLWIPKGLVIPFIAEAPAAFDRKILRIRIRRPEGEPRYYALKDSNMDCLIVGKPGRLAVVVESELDAILLDRYCGDIAAIVALGNSSRKPDTKTAAVLKGSTVILLAVDFDHAGINQVPWWREHFEQAKFWPVPDSKDPGDAFKAGVDLRAWVIAGCPKGWHVEPSLLGVSQRDDDPVADDAPLGDLMPYEKIKELAELLKDTPVFISNTAKRTGLHAPQVWIDRNWKTYQAISQLIYFDEDVIDYIRSHPEQRINAVNLKKKE